VTALRPSGSLLGAILAAVVSLWVGFAVVAGATRTAPRPATHAQPVRGSAAINLGLSSVPALRARPALFKLAPASATAPPAPPTAMSAAPSPESVEPTSTPAAPAATPEPAHAVQPSPAPAPRPAPKPRPSPAAEPKHPSGPDFDESAPGGFDNSG
jgi:outer membrane biosynthesis protein TonB